MDFQKIAIRQVKSNRCLRPLFITVNRNALCRFVCVCRTDVRVRAFESPDPGLCFKYPHHGCWMPRKFFTGPQRSGSHFFLSLVHSVEENLEISWSQKSEFWWSKWLEKKFFCKCFWGVWNMKGWCLGCIQRVSSFRTPIEGIFLLFSKIFQNSMLKMAFSSCKSASKPM